MTDRSDPSTWTPRQLRENCPLCSACQELLHTAVCNLNLSSKDHDQILRAAKLNAQKDKSASINPSHLTDAIDAYRLE
ncbi:magnesium chelatase subunit ChlI family protein [Neorhodopirellula lusitana]|uniref:magnesium chelatase subunit ChlI family protein n=1 Tax=Neorhodopirellula lusitana TaxID=445327 RepID=UPI00384C3EB8